jgi:hypothetical protein
MDFESEYRKLLGLVCSTLNQGFERGEMDNNRNLQPNALRFVYEIAGRMRINHVHNRLLKPSQLRLDDDGFVTFAEENQNVVVWGFKASELDADPMVFQKHFDGESFGPWIAEGQSISRFLISFGYWSAANGAADATAVGEIGAATRAKVEPLPLVWKCPDFDVRGGDDGLVIVTSEGDFYAFGRDREKIEQFVDSLEVDWFDMDA